MARLTDDRRADLVERFAGRLTPRAQPNPGAVAGRRRRHRRGGRRRPRRRRGDGRRPQAVRGRGAGGRHSPSARGRAARPRSTARSGPRPSPGPAHRRPTGGPTRHGQPIRGRRSDRRPAARDGHRAADVAEPMRRLCDEWHPDAGRARVVRGNRNAHTPGALYGAPGPAEARRRAARVEFRDTPEHAPRRNTAERELSARARPCPGRRTPDAATPGTPGKTPGTATGWRSTGASGSPTPARRWRRSTPSKLPPPTTSNYGPT